MSRRLSISLVLGLWMPVQSATAVWHNITTVRQCEPLVIRASDKSLSGNPTRNVTVSIIPVNDTALAFPLTNASVLSTGVTVNFLPFHSDSYFIASLDDAVTGSNVIEVSDLIRVLPSSAQNSSACLPPSNTAQKQFRVTSTLSQCETFAISYDTSLVSQAPRVRLYQPKGPAIALILVTDDTQSGIASYMLTSTKGNSVILLMESGNGIHESTQVFTVQGDSTSPTSCLSSLPSNPIGKDEGEGPCCHGATRRSVIIGSVLGGSAILLTLTVWLGIRRHRKCRPHGGLLFECRQSRKSTPPNNDKVDAFARGPIAYELQESKSRIGPIKPSSVGVDPPQEDGVTPPIRQPFVKEAICKPPTLKLQRRSISITPIEQWDIETMLDLATMKAEFDSDSRCSLTSTMDQTLPMNSPVERNLPSPSFVDVSLPQKPSSARFKPMPDVPYTPLPYSPHVRSISLPYYTPSTLGRTLMPSSSTKPGTRRLPISSSLWWASPPRSESGYISKVSTDSGIHAGHATLKI